MILQKLCSIWSKKRQYFFLNFSAKIFLKSCHLSLLLLRHAPVKSSDEFEVELFPDFRRSELALEAVRHTQFPVALNPATRLERSRIENIGLVFWKRQCLGKYES
jgi:hypothetical protein